MGMLFSKKMTPQELEDFLKYQGQKKLENGEYCYHDMSVFKHKIRPKKILKYSVVLEKWQYKLLCPNLKRMFIEKELTYDVGEEGSAEFITDKKYILKSEQNR